MPTQTDPALSPELLLVRAHSVPLYRQLADQLRSAIADGRLPPGSRLDNEIVLAHRLGISRPTVRRAIQEVVADGLLSRRRGIGTRVVHVRIDTTLEPLGIVETLRRDGHNPDARLIDDRTVAASSQIALGLALPPHTAVLHFRRILSSNGAPLALLTNHVPIDIGFPTEPELESTGLYTLLRDSGTEIDTVEERIIARAATAVEAGHLGLGSDSAVLERTRIARDVAGRPVVLGVHAFRGDLIGIHVTT